MKSLHRLIVVSPTHLFRRSFSTAKKPAATVVTKTQFGQQSPTHSSFQPLLLNEALPPSAQNKFSSSALVISVFGCSSFVGRYVVNALAKTGAQIITPYRDTIEQVRHLRVSGDVGQIVSVRYDPRDDNELFEIARRSNMVVNLIGREVNGYLSENSVWNANVEMAEKIARVCADAQVDKLIHLSALGANAESNSEFLRSKFEGERRIREIYPAATIFRPAPIFGFEDRLLNFVAQGITLLPGFPLVNRGRGLLAPVSAIDVAAAVVRSVENSNTDGRLYELAGNEVYSWSQLVDLVASEINEDPDRMPLMEVFAKMLARLNEFRIEPTLTRDWVERAKLNFVPNGSELGFADMDLVPSSLKDSTFMYCARWKRGGYFLDLNTKERI